MVSNMTQWDERILRSVRSAATRSMNANRGFVESDDLQQEGYVWVLTHADKVNGWLDEGRDGAKLLNHALYQHMHQYTMSQRYLKDGTKPGDYYRYQLAVLEALLPDALDDEPYYGSQPTDVNAGIRGSRLVNEGGDRLAMIADVRMALAGLTSEDLLLITEKFGAGEPVPDEKLAALYGTSASTVARMVKKVLKKMAAQLGSEPFSTRRVMTNAQAQHVTKEQGE